MAESEGRRHGRHGTSERPEAERDGEVEQPYDADVAASNSDAEAAWDVDAPSAAAPVESVEPADSAASAESAEPAEPVESGPGHDLEPVGFGAFRSWPRIPPPVRRNRKEEADAFFSFFQRWQQEQQAMYGDDRTPVPVDPPDPRDNALIGAAAQGQSDLQAHDLYPGDGFDDEGFYVGYDDEGDADDDEDVDDELDDDDGDADDSGEPDRSGDPDRYGDADRYGDPNRYGADDDDAGDEDGADDDAGEGLWARVDGEES